jgi:hypothetical protein
MAVQPTLMKSDTGVILTIGFVSPNDRSAIVIPICRDSASDPVWQLTEDAVLSFHGTWLTSLLGLIANDCYCSFMAAEAMDDGYVPYREDYSSSAHPGTSDTGCMPGQVSSLMIFYADPNDIVTPGRERVGKNFIPCVPTSQVDGDNLVDGYITLGKSVAEDIQAGLDSIAGGDAKWWRILAAPKPRSPAQDVKRTIISGMRGYVCTQRRRLIPR